MAQRALSAACCSSGDVGRALLGLPCLRLQRREALLASGPAWRRIVATVSRCPDDGCREPGRACARGLAGAVEPLAAARRVAAELGRASGPSRPPRARAARSAPSRVRGPRSRSRPRRARWRRGSPRSGQARPGCRARAGGWRPAAARRRASGGRSRFAASRRPPSRASSLERASRRACSCLRAREGGLGRVELQKRRRLGACEARRPAWPGSAPVCAAPTVGVDPVKRMPLQNGHAEQRPRRGRRSHKAETVAKNGPSTGVKSADLQGF